MLFDRFLLTAPGFDDQGFLNGGYDELDGRRLEQLCGLYFSKIVLTMLL